ncbi:MAG: hypothetical protein JST67_06630 [Bacteroidetes bacterium]|nr:hypothetical protein [Bacteroidota bacterium]
MPKTISIETALLQEKSNTPHEEALLNDVKRLFLNNRFHKKNVLENLKQYNTSFEFFDDDEMPEQGLFTQEQIKKTCIKYRFRFLPATTYKGEIPYEVHLKIQDLNTRYRKTSTHFKILSSEHFFTKKESRQQALFFAETWHGNYYLVHSWGTPYHNDRLLRCLPARNFETLLACFVVLSLLETALLPNKIISTDMRAGYFSMYRAAAWLHLFILQCGLATFFLMAAHFTFSANNWYKKPFSPQSQSLGANFF